MANSAIEAGTIAGGNVLIQEVYAFDNTEASTTTAIPRDDTIPQNTEGSEFMTLAITPTSATNILVIDVSCGQCSSTSGGYPFAGAIFQDSTANALAAANSTIATGASFFIRHVMVAGTTSSTTF